MFKTINKKITNIIHKSKLYKIWLNSRNTEKITNIILDPWSGNASFADEIFQGRYNFAGKEIHAPRQPLWDPPGVGTWWLSEMHGFSWLRHFKAREGKAAQQHSRALITNWMNSGHSDWHPISWRPDILGRRICAWIAHSDLILNDADESFREKFLKLLSSQSRHLSNIIEKSNLEAEKFTAIRGLIISGISLSKGAKRLNQAKKVLLKCIEREILDDGCYINRQPSSTLEILADLIWIRNSLYDHDSLPEIINTTITKMSFSIRSLRLGDGTLARLNGGKSFSREAIDKVLDKTSIKLSSRISGSLITAGYERLAAGRTIIVMDCSQAQEKIYSGSLSFEMSVSRDRLIVNCGPGLINSEKWQKALSASAAHSTLVINDTNSSSAKNKRIPIINIKRSVLTGGEQIFASHNGYYNIFTAKHERTLQLDKRGTILKGIDSIISGPGLKFQIHFHLHPRATTQLSRNNEKALISLPSGGWEFSIINNKNSFDLTTEKSIYIEDDETTTNSQQIIISGNTSNTGAKINWCLIKKYL